jgi:hypothetical protein
MGCGPILRRHPDRVLAEPRPRRRGGPSGSPAETSGFDSPGKDPTMEDLEAQRRELRDLRSPGDPAEEAGHGLLALVLAPPRGGVTRGVARPVVKASYINLTVSTFASALMEATILLDEIGSAPAGNVWRTGLSGTFARPQTSLAQSTSARQSSPHASGSWAPSTPTPCALRMLLKAAVASASQGPRRHRPPRGVRVCSRFARIVAVSWSSLPRTRSLSARV